MLCGMHLERNLFEKRCDTRPKISACAEHDLDEAVLANLLSGQHRIEFVINPLL